MWQVPSNVYSQVSVSYAELEEKIGGTSKLADYLISQLRGVEQHLLAGSRSSPVHWATRRPFR